MSINAVSSAATRVLPERRAVVSAAAAATASPRAIVAANAHSADVAAARARSPGTAGRRGEPRRAGARILDAVMGRGDYRLDPCFARATPCPGKAPPDPEGNHDRRRTPPRGRAPRRMVGAVDVPEHPVVRVRRRLGRRVRAVLHLPGPGAGAAGVDPGAARVRGRGGDRVA